MSAAGPRSGERGDEYPCRDVAKHCWHRTTLTVRATVSIVRNPDFSLELRMDRAVRFALHSPHMEVPAMLAARDSRRVFFLLVLLAILVAAAPGCTSALILPKESDTPAKLVEVDTAAGNSDDAEQAPRFVKDLASPWNTTYLKVESVGLVTGLAGTGSDPPPSPQRAMLLDEMEKHDVKNPNQVLASPDTSLVLVRGYLPPGVQKGDPFDVEIRLPSRSETKSLRGGWLMKARLREVAILNNAMRTGRVDAFAQGPVVVDAAFENSEEVHLTRGHVLSGGVAAISRPLGLVVREDQHSVRTSAMIGAAINTRFCTFDRGIKRGVATPKRDDFIELAVHPGYKHNLGRYVRVIQNIALRESPAERHARIQLLEQKLLEPTTCLEAALQLEAIGKDAIPILRRAIASEDPEIRFYSAEALAYLDESDAAEPLAKAARDESAFRWHAIAALAAMDNASAYDSLIELFDSSSAETRYAAFRALRLKNPSDPLVRGELLDDKFSYHLVPSEGPPLIHFSRSRRAEMVVFGQQQHMQPPAFLYAGPSILLKGAGADRIKVTKFSPQGEDQHEVCSTRLDDVIRTIVKLGGSYEDVLSAMLDAKQKQYLEGRVVIDALPRPGRVYRRDEAVGTGVAGSEGDDAEERSAATAKSPLPDIFQNRLLRDEGEGDGGGDSDEPQGNIDPEPPPEEPSFFGKLGGWFTGAEN